MFVAHLCTALLVALLLTILLIPRKTRKSAQDRGGTAGAVLVLFFILFLAAWAGGLWITPFGPRVFGVFWIPFLVAGLFFGLLWTAVDMAFHRNGRRRTTKANPAERVAVAAAFSLLASILIIGLALAVVAGYSVM